jgi:hypothetical protein
MLREMSLRIGAIALLVMAGCAGHPVQIGIYTPYPKEVMMGEVRQKVTELGYTIQRLDTVNYELVADRTLEPPVKGSSKEEMVIRIAPDNTGSTKMTITAARIIPATADHPLKRVTASARTNADANAVLQMYMKARRGSTSSPSNQ